MLTISALIPAMPFFPLRFNHLSDRFPPNLGGSSDPNLTGSGPMSPKTLDDDEDRRNPAFIPRRGNFYEHDDRQVVES